MFFDNYMIKVTDFFLKKNLPIYENILPQQELVSNCKIVRVLKTGNGFEKFIFSGSMHD